VDQRGNNVVQWQTWWVSHEADFSAQRFRRGEVTCEELTVLIGDYLTAKLDAETTMAFDQHLQGCSDCMPLFEHLPQNSRCSLLSPQCGYSSRTAGSRPTVPPTKTKRLEFYAYLVPDLKTDQAWCLLTELRTSLQFCQELFSRNVVEAGEGQDYSRLR
jgi:predicted anti-sigma-YlaC factor YlaD